MENKSIDKGVWTRVSEDGKSAAAGMSLGSDGGVKVGAGGKPQPFGWHGYYGETGGDSSSGPVYRGKVTLPHEARGTVSPPVQKGKVVPPSPPAPRQPHLIYSQSTGQMKHEHGELAGRGYSGKGNAKNQPERECEKDIGPIPRGNYKVAEIVDDPSDRRCQKMGPHILRLEPADQATRDRLTALDRDGFYIHGGGSDASTGCIILDSKVRAGIGKGALIQVRR